MPEMQMILRRRKWNLVVLVPDVVLEPVDTGIGDSPAAAMGTHRAYEPI
jgi:hypothetical protein